MTKHETFIARRITFLLMTPPALDGHADAHARKSLLAHFRHLFPHIPFLQRFAAPFIFSSIAVGALLFFVIRHHQSQTADELRLIQTDLTTLEISQDQFL